MDTWAEERREVLESVLDTLRRTEQSEESDGACKYLLRHLLTGYSVPGDITYERCRHTHAFS